MYHSLIHWKYTSNEYFFDIDTGKVLKIRKAIPMPIPNNGIKGLDGWGKLFQKYLDGRELHFFSIRRKVTIVRTTNWNRKNSWYNIKGLVQK